jgi:hypothetical protein
MKTSQIAAKIVTRLFLIFLCIALIPFLQGDNTRLSQLYLIVPNKWTLVFPVLLMLGFITLFVLVSIKKYKAVDLNWLLVLNTVVLLIYGIALFIRIYHAIK